MKVFGMMKISVWEPKEFKFMKNNIITVYLVVCTMGSRFGRPDNGAV